MWLKKRVVKGIERNIKITKKEQYIVSIKEAVEEFQNSIPIFMKHVAAIKHQYKFIKSLKETITESDILLHIDFSENFSCKYFEEIQSIHFGASRKQISIHTGVTYSYNNSERKVEASSFATMSENLRHDPPSIWAHLHPVISHFISKNPKVERIHFLSDSPTTQYRNKTNFYFFQNLNKRYPEIKEGSWNFSESGHGKGAPDGVGAVIKRTADRLIAEGNDVTNVEDLCEMINKNVKNVKIWKISDKDILNTEELFPQHASLATTVGTMSIHQVTFQKSTGLQDFRTLSCLKCNLNMKCCHYPLTTKMKRKNNTNKNDNKKRLPSTTCKTLGKTIFIN